MNNMELSKNQKKLLNNADQKLRRARKEIKMVIEEESNSDKFRSPEKDDSDEGTMKVQKSNQD